MAVGVVVLLEVIDVAHQHCAGVREATRAAHLVGEGFHEITPVIQTREIVRDREALELAPALLQPRHHVVEHLGDVAELSPARDGQLHLEVSSGHPGSAPRQAIERPRDQ